MKILLSLFLLSTPAAAAQQSARLSFDPACVLSAVAFAMNVGVQPAVALPRIRTQTETPLAEFQDAIEPQWGFRPDVFTNAYVPAARTIFLLDEAEYYAKHGASIDDSLAHELIHYIQVRYKGLTMKEFTEWEEAEARQFQIWFRDHYVNGTPPPGAPVCSKTN